MKMDLMRGGKGRVSLYTFYQGGQEGEIALHGQCAMPFNLPFLDITTKRYFCCFCQVESDGYNDAKFSDLKWEVGIGSESNAFNKASQLWAHSFPHTALPSGTPLEVIPWRNGNVSQQPEPFLTQILFHFLVKVPALPSMHHMSISPTTCIWG